MLSDVRSILSIDDAGERLAALCEWIDSRLQDHRLAELSRVEQVIHLVNRFDFELSLGGLESLMYNSAGDIVGEMIPALREVGATSTAEEMSRLEALLVEEGPSKSNPRTHRHEAFVSLKSAAPGKIEEIEKMLRANGDDLFALCCSYLEAHREELAEGGDSVGRELG